MNMRQSKRKSLARWVGGLGTAALFVAALAAGSAWGEDAAPAGEKTKEPHPAAKAGESSKKDDHGAHHDPFDHVMDNDGIELIGGKSIRVQLWNPGGFRVVTKFMLLEVLAAVLVAAIYIPLARRVRTGEPPRGPWANAFEVLLTFIRE